jgi:hypothetical protein
VGLLHRADRVLPAAAARRPPDDYLVVVTTADFTWRRLLEVSAYGLIAVLAFVSLVVRRGLDPTGALLAVLLVTAVVLLRLNRYGVAGVAGSALLYGGWTGYRGGLAALAHPSSAAEFWHAATAFVLVLVSLAAAVGEQRPRPASRLPALVGVGALALTLLAAVLGVGSSLGYDDPVRSAGDLDVRVERFEWAPKAVEAEAGGITIFVANKDAARHTFTVRELGVSVDVPANHSARVRFDAPVGTYRFECTVEGHDHVGIRGTLFVR